MPDHDGTDQGMSWREVSPLIETGCWFAIVLAPFLRWVNGPAVSRDQYIVQIAVVSLAVVGAVGLRIYHWRTRA